MVAVRFKDALRFYGSIRPTGTIRRGQRRPQYLRDDDNRCVSFPRPCLTAFPKSWTVGPIPVDTR